MLFGLTPVLPPVSPAAAGLSSALGSSRHINSCSAGEDKLCDFVCDCPEDCSDEEDCGYDSDPLFICDFEKDTCGWRDQNVHSYKWGRHSGYISGDGASDHTLGTDRGWFMAVGGVHDNILTTAVLVSPRMRQAAPACELRFWYRVWDSGRVGVDAGSLFATLRSSSREAVVWRSAGSSVRGWREASIFTGRVPEPFQIVFTSRRSLSYPGDIAIDDIKFLNCALPQPVFTCPDQFLCAGGMCVEMWQTCDGTDDCGDSSDEGTELCAQYRKCDFQNGTCDWTNRKWERTNQASFSPSDLLIGPARDHTENTNAGYFLYIGSSNGATLLSPPIERPSDPESCFLVLYYHMFGPRAASLNIYHRTQDPAELILAMSEQGERGDLWVREKVHFAVNTSFQIVIEGVLGGGTFGNIALDDLILSPGCRVSNDSLSPDWELPTAAPSRCNQGQFECRNGRCVDHNLVCDFRLDCSDQSDEMDCGNATFDVSDGGWRDHSAGRLEWTVRKNTSSSRGNTDKDFAMPCLKIGCGRLLALCFAPLQVAVDDMKVPDLRASFSLPAGGHLSLAKAHGQMLSKAIALSPVLGPSGPACSMQFRYLLHSNSTFTGGIAVSSVNQALGTEVLLWRTHRKRDKWTTVAVSVGARPRGFQIEITALVDNFAPRGQKVAVDDIAFLNCSPDLEPPTAADVSCNFEEGLCGWYQDQTDELEWTRDVGPGFDHTTGSGHFVFVDASSPDLGGHSARLLSYPQRSSVETMCLSFWYHLMGPQTGTLSLKLRLGGGDEETVLWTRSGTQGNEWQRGLSPVPHQDRTFELVFEALRDGFDGDISLDDITLSSQPCSALQSCSFEESQCDFVSSGRGGWRKQSGWTGGIASGPKIDHTLETDRGFYMIVDTSHDVMSSGQSASLYSGLTSALRGPECVQFWYHMSGDKPGSLSVFVEESGEQRVEVFSESVAQGAAWRFGNANIGATAEWKIIFQAVGAAGTSSHIAVDDITFRAGSCSKPGDLIMNRITEGCRGNHWTLLALGLDQCRDHRDWTSAGTTGKYPGPGVDHTLKTRAGHYVFLSSASRAGPGQKAWLLSEHLPATQGSCLGLWYHLDSAIPIHMGDLRVLLLKRFQSFNSWEVRGHTGRWAFVNFTLKSNEEFQVVLEASTGESGTIALDDIAYSAGLTCEGVQSDTPVPAPSSYRSSGIVASVLVVILFLSTVAGVLLFLYCRHRGSLSGCSLFTRSSEMLSEETGFDNTGYRGSLSGGTMFKGSSATGREETGFDNIGYSHSDEDRITVPSMPES
ncbi:apical endosomal glycoprotein [Polyodon spathula]|uniref:apical endosomal glycoprotein n=1 Tax=Polyodon spathula TaxID=7913 RepID=UPI001B7F19CE|nr:apical endosomal glycoprotein [Polyodon spathula]